MKNFFLISVLLGLCSNLFGQDKFIEAINTANEGKINEAIKMLDELIAEDSKQARFYESKSICYLNGGNYLEALDVLTQAIELMPDTAYLYNAKGILNEQLRNFQNAITDFSIGITKAEDQKLKANMLSNLSGTLFKIRDFQSAYDKLIEALSLDPDNVDILNNLATCCDEVGKPDETLKYLERIIVIQDDYIPAYVNLGFKYQLMEDHKSALKYLDKAVELGPTEALCYSNRSFSRYKLGDLKGGMEDINKSIKLKSSNSYAYKIRALIYIEEGEQAKACDDLNTALKKGYTNQYGEEVNELRKTTCVGDGIEAGAEMVSKDSILLGYVFYLLDDENLTFNKLNAEVKKINPALNSFKTFESLAESQEPGVLLTVIDNARKDFPAPDLEYLKYFGKSLSEEEKKKMQSSNTCVILDFYFAKANINKALKDANKLINDLVQNREAVVYDPQTRESFSKNHWKDTKLVRNNSINVANHISIHYYHDGELCRGITLGMKKFGLPDLCIEKMSCRASDSFISLINLSAQTLYENEAAFSNGTLDLDIHKLKNEAIKSDLLASCYDNAKHKAKLSFIKGTWKEGDPQNALLELSFTGGNPQIAQDELLSTVFGYKDEVTMAVHDEELLKAKKEAKAKIPKLKKRFQKGLKEGSVLMFKFPFKSMDDQNEWMWVEVTKWKGDIITGLLQNKPTIATHLKAGQKVSTHINEMFDYLIYHADGSEEGNETSKILIKRQNKNN